jgi:hypothetical protein
MKLGKLFLPYRRDWIGERSCADGNLRLRLRSHGRIGAGGMAAAGSGAGKGSAKETVEEASDEEGEEQDPRHHQKREADRHTAEKGFHTAKVTMGQS